ncbi:MAG: tryptophan--tRNA ligase [Candidatus Latescibacteria bacterium]|nr:tryptophan--tRNA ligase [Candidatus Latescibacterota bacterium]
MRVLSGIQPSGNLHLGNYFGMMRRMIDYQDSSELFAFLANMHAMTSVFDGKELAKGTMEAAINFLALGLDPEKAVFWVQSDVPEVMELTWYLSNMAPVGLLERSHSYKDKVAKGISPNAGLFLYPVLMAADILLYQSDIVPVGRDQKQHLEITRDIAVKFNNTFGETFVVPDAEIDGKVSIVPGVDGQKMSKSYGNAIEIFVGKNALKKRIMSIVTDSTPVEEPKDPEKCTVFALYKLFASPGAVSDMAGRYRAGGLGYGEVKKELLELIWNFFAPYREKREELLADPARVRKILLDGADKARYHAVKTLRKVRKRVGSAYFRDK